jgi:PIN domain nuclease of toxin-antitoxin system
LSEGDPARGYLLDTHTALWALDRPEALGNAARNAVSSGPNFLSVVSYWEVMLKSMKGKLDVGDPRAWWFDALEQLAATPLVLRPQHIAAVYSLPPIHKDPFDRLLIAQATVEGLALVSSDGEIARYRSKGLRVVG